MHLDRTLELAVRDEKQEVLNAQARRIFFAIFREEVSLKLMDRFVQGYPLVFGGYADEAKNELSRIIDSTEDLEAFEFASRLLRRFPLLTLSFRYVFALAECEPTFRRQMINRSQNRWQAWVALITAGAASVFKLLKGLFLLLRFERGRVHE